MLCSFQDLTITVASELPSTECELIEDREEHHVVNRQSFVDEQEWHLYVHTECNKKELVIDQVDNSVKRSALSVKCRAARRPGYFVWNIFMITVSDGMSCVFQTNHYYYVTVLNHIHNPNSNLLIKAF